MERLTGQDAAFLYNETPRQHMHTLKIAVLDPTGIEGGYSFERVKEVLASRLDLLPPFRRRVQEVPLRLHHPVWIDDDRFDLDRHVHRVVLPPPGGREEFDDAVSEVASRQLDRSRPLWEVVVIEGMEGGRVGFVAKIHHCVADGVRAAELLATVFDTEPEGAAEPSSSTWTPRPAPSRGRFLQEALRDLGRELIRLPVLVARTIAGLRKVAQRRKTGAAVPPRPFSGPDLSFNASLTPRRLFVTLTLPLAEVKDVKNALGATLNDVVLALCAGGLRSYLDERGELPDKPLVASVPVSTRTEAVAGRANSVSNMFTSVPVHLDDPIERVRAAHDVAIGAKEQLQLIGADLLEQWQELTPALPYSGFIRLYGGLRLADHHRPPINLVISNVPGPPTPLYIAGARLEAIYSMGPILENIGLNITVWSYLDAMNFGIVAVPEHLPDLRRLTDHLREALNDLTKAASTYTA